MTIALFLEPGWPQNESVAPSREVYIIHYTRDALKTY